MHCTFRVFWASLWFILSYWEA